MGSARDVWVYRHRENEVLFLAIEVVKMILPQLLHFPRRNPAMTIGSSLYEHKRGKVIQVSAKGSEMLRVIFEANLHQFAGISTSPVSDPLTKGFIQCSGFLS